MYELSDSAKEILLKVAKHITENPIRYDENFIFTPEFLRDAPKTGDISGHIAYLQAEKGLCQVDEFTETVSVNGAIQDANEYAAEIIGVPYQWNGRLKQHPLFHVGCWAEPYCSQFYAANNDELQAEIAAARIRYFVKTGE